MNQINNPPSTDGLHINYSRIINELHQASIFDLYRLSVAIRNEMEQPKRTKEIQGSLKIGQFISYYDRVNNRLRNAQLLGKNPKYAVILDLEDHTQWKIPYFFLNLQDVDIQIQQDEGKQLDKNVLAVGDLVGFTHENKKIIGRIIRLNFKTVTLVATDGRQWRVTYSLLTRIVDINQKFDVIDV
jgi:hypothetical protein